MTRLEAVVEKTLESGLSHTRKKLYANGIGDRSSQFSVPSGLRLSINFKLGLLVKMFQISMIVLRQVYHIYHTQSGI